jgi:outer membrane protein assembly factor BamD (BamD/ComL family)
LTFLNRHPDTAVSDQARQRLLAVEREAHKKQTESAAAQSEWNAANKNDVAAIGDIVARFPDAPFVGDAKNRISELQREEKAQAEKTAARDWHELKNSRDAAAIRAFIRKYPTTSLALNEAKERLDALIRESEPRHSADARQHHQIASKPAARPAEPAHRPEPSPGARNFSGVGF